MRSTTVLVQVLVDMLTGYAYKNHVPIHHYIKHLDKQVIKETLTLKEQMEEELFLGLRKKKV